MCMHGSGGLGAPPFRGPCPLPLRPLLAGYSISSFLQMLHPECKELPEPNLLPGQLSHGAVGVKEGRVQWISMAFESVSRGAPRGTGALVPVSPPREPLRPRHVERLACGHMTSEHGCLGLNQATFLPG